MKLRDVSIHLLGAFMVLSTLFFSDHYPQVWIITIPVLITSISHRFKKKRPELLGIVLFTLASAYFIVPEGLDDIYFISVFTILYLAPLTAYWLLVLSEHIDFHWQGLSTCIVYISSVVVLFYVLILVSNIGEYMMTQGNYAPQALVLSASALIAFIPAHLLMSRDS